MGGSARPPVRGIRRQRERQLEALAEVEIDWIAPYPAAEFLEGRGHRVLPCSSALAGSGRAYEGVFAGCSEEFNLMDYIRVESRGWHLRRGGGGTSASI